MHVGQHGTRHWQRYRPGFLADFIHQLCVLSQEEGEIGTYTLAFVNARSQFCLLTMEIISGVCFF